MKKKAFNSSCCLLFRILTEHGAPAGTCDAVAVRSSSTRTSPGTHSPVAHGPGCEAAKPKKEKAQEQARTRSSFLCKWIDDGSGPNSHRMSSFSLRSQASCSGPAVAWQVASESRGLNRTSVRNLALGSPGSWLFWAQAGAGNFRGSGRRCKYLAVPIWLCMCVCLGARGAEMALLSRYRYQRV